MSVISGGDIVALVTGGVVESSVVSTPVGDTSGDTVLDTKIRPKVVSVINKYGKVLTYTVDSSSVHNPATGEVAISSDDVTKRSIPPYQADFRHIDGDVVKESDLFTGIAAQGLTFTPVLGMIVAVGTTKYKILKMKPVYSGNQIALHLFQLRK